MTKKIAGAIKGRPRSFDREAALDAALRLFWRHGFEGTAISDLVRELGIAAPSIYAAFGSKEALFNEAIGLYGHKYGIAMKCLIEQEATAEASVRAILFDAASTFAMPGLPGGCFVASGMLAWAPPQKELARVFRSKRALMIGALRSRIDQGVAAGELPEGTDSHDLGNYYGAVIEGMSVQARDGADAQALRRVAEVAMKAWPNVEVRARRRSAAARPPTSCQPPQTPPGRRRRH